jgi:tryptophanyl-tRNA synthetase
MNKKINLFSGIKPTGNIHLGNYLGALKNWVLLQDSGKYKPFYSIVDLHALTMDYDPKEYQQLIHEALTDLLAIGINPKKSTLFIQSQLPEHSELCWLLNNITPVAELNRMTQFKDKAQENIKNINAGLLDYPILMAADILLYHATAVPVGEDQLQHLELTNTIIRKFNNRFGKYFEEVKPILNEASRVMSLTNPLKKMSKSLGPNNLIALSDSPEIIKKKISSAVTDSGENGKMSAGVANLFFLLEEFANPSIVKRLNADQEQGKLKYSELKSELSEALIAFLKPIQKKKALLMKQRSTLNKIITDGRKQASSVAKITLKEVKKLMGLI